MKYQELVDNNGLCWRRFGPKPSSVAFFHVFRHSSSLKRNHKEQLPLGTLRDYFEVRKKYATLILATTSLVGLNSYPLPRLIFRHL
jgi:hypothetical protein